MRVALALLFGVAVSTALPTTNVEFGNRIVGGSTTTIRQYPFMASLLADFFGNNHRQTCGGTVINNRSILTAAHCMIFFSSASQWRVRLGSTNANRGGRVINVQQIIRHNNFHVPTLDHDIALLRLSGTISFNNDIRAARIAGPNYNVADNQQVWAAGWGATCFQCSASEQLRHVQIWTINQNTCRQRYAQIGRTVTDNMMCSGVLNQGGRDQCQGDSGGPLLHNGIVVGVCSWGHECAHPNFPGVNARVARSSNWIQANS